MTPEEKIEHRLTVVEENQKINAKRLNVCEEKLKTNTELIGAIKELATETKYMREDINETMNRLDKLENKDGESWEKFKWLIVGGIVTIVLGYLAMSLGLK